MTKLHAMKQHRRKMDKRTVIKLERFNWGFFTWTVYFNVLNNERLGSVDTWGTLTTFFFIPVVWKYRDL